MARTISDIKKQIAVEFLKSPIIRSLYNVQENADFEAVFSKASIESILFYVIAFCIWTVESLFDTHKAEVADYIARMKPHTAGWYSTKAKDFQYGFDLLPDSDSFNKGNHGEEDIEASKVVKYCSVSEVENLLNIKVAGISNSGDLAELPAEQMTSFGYYMNKIKDAGVRLNFLTYPADQLYLSLQIYYNPLVLNSQGKRIDGTSDKPVSDAVRAYLAGIEFDGTIVLAGLIDKLQAIEGVMIPHIVAAKYSYASAQNVDIDIKYKPVAGYARITDNNLIIQYIPET